MTLLLGFAAVNTGNNLLYLLVSALLGFMSISGIFGRWNLAGLRVDLVLPDEIYDGVETMLTVRFENSKRWLPSFLLALHLPVGRTTAVHIARRDTASETLYATFHGRGIQSIGQGRVESIFPINFFVRSFPIPVERKITVFPAPRFCRNTAAEAGRSRAGGEFQAGRKGYEGDISRISDYSGGEPLKLIHWKLSARHGMLKVKELSTVTRPPVVLELAHLPGNLEDRLRCASYLIGSCLRENRPVGLRLGPRMLLAPDVGRAHKLRLLTELAAYGQH
jgi:uncharacterized protein (DUF58 family)